MKATRRRRKQPVHTGRTRELLIRDGWNVVERVERDMRIVDPQTGDVKVWKEDLGGFADMLAWSAGKGALMVQVCGLSRMAAHIAKIISEPRAIEWLRSAPCNRIAVYAWDQPRGPRTKWVHRVREIEEEDYPDNWR